MGRAVGEYSQAPDARLDLLWFFGLSAEGWGLRAEGLALEFRIMAQAGILIGVSLERQEHAGNQAGRCNKRYTTSHQGLGLGL